MTVVLESDHVFPHPDPAVAVELVAAISNRQENLPGLSDEERTLSHVLDQFERATDGQTEIASQAGEA